MFLLFWVVAVVEEMLPNAKDLQRYSSREKAIKSLSSFKDVVPASDG